MMSKPRTDVIALRKLMIEKGFFTISQLSKVSGISRKTLSKVLKENAQPSSPVMYKLSETLNVYGEKAGEIFFKQ